MKKIMFSDRFGLNQAVIDGTKTMTRRIVPKSLAGLVEAMSKPILIVQESIIPQDMSPEDFLAEMTKNGIIQYKEPEVELVENKKALTSLLLKAQYKLGEEVAVAQCYEDAILDVGEEEWNKRHKWYCIENLRKRAGLHNKMFVQADLMPHRIRITKVRIERLQDISNEDCLREGIRKCNIVDTRIYKRPLTLYSFLGAPKHVPMYRTPRNAFAALIDKMSGKGTWDKNPWVFVYEFELVK